MTTLLKTVNGAAGLYGNAINFTPTQLTGCKLWLKGDAGVTLVSSVVSAWADQSGNGNNFSQSTAGNRPGYNATGLNGLPIITGNASQWLTSSYTPSTNTSVFIVFRNTRTGTLTNQLDTLITGSDSSLNGLRFESFNYFAGGVFVSQRAVIGSGSGTILNYKNGTGIAGSGLQPYCALNEWCVGVLTNSGQTNLAAAKILSNWDASIATLSDIAEIIVYNRVVTASEQTQVEQYLALKWGITHSTIANRVIINAGDSITRGYQLDVDGSYPYQLLALYNNDNSYRMHNEAVDGSTINNCDTRAAGVNGIDTWTYSAKGPKLYLVIWAGTNDLYVSGSSAATAYSALLTYITNRKATGIYYKILVCTCIPRGSSTTNWSLYNTQITTNWSSLQAAGADVLIDFTSNTHFSLGTSPSNATYYNADLTHLTLTGEGLIAGMVKTGLDTVP